MMDSRSIWHPKLVPKGSKMMLGGLQNEAWRDKIAQSIAKRDQHGSKMRQERAKETPMSAQGRPNARPRRPNRSPEAPQMVQNRCQNVLGIDDQIR